MKKKYRIFFTVFIVLLLALTGCTLTNNDTSITDTSVNSSSQQTEPPANIDTTTDFDFETKTVMLNSGYEMPIIGLGTWTLDDKTAENSVYHALKDGYRLIDTAKYYGNAQGVGDEMCIRDSFLSFLLSQLWGNILQNELFEILSQYSVFSL